MLSWELSSRSWDAFSDLIEIQTTLEHQTGISMTLPLFYRVETLTVASSLLGTTNGVFVHGMVDEIERNISSWRKWRWSGVQKLRKNVNAFTDGDSDAIDYNDDPEDEDAYEADPALSYDDENQMMRKRSGSLRCEINNRSDDLGRCGSRGRRVFRWCWKISRIKLANIDELSYFRYHIVRAPLFESGLP